MNKQQRYRLIISRQGEFSWNREYQPSIRATRAEGPKCSRLSQLWSEKLGRILHLLSRGERIFAQLALYNPSLFDLHEQRMLSPITTAHPLQGHPRAKGMQLPNLLGTVDIAIREGGTHEKIYTSIRGEDVVLPYPYLGDLLLFLEEPEKLPYCVNWTIKGEVADFSEKRRTTLKSLQAKKRDQQKAEYRHFLEREHYSAAGIRTVQLVPSDIDENVRFNLDLLFGWLGNKWEFDQSLTVDFDSEVNRAVSFGIPLSRVVIKFSSRWGARDKFLGRIYQNIWHRKLKVNLFSPLLIDKPMSTNCLDVLDVYGAFFSGDVS